MEIKLRYFGVLKDLLARDVETLELADGGTVKDAISLLRSRASNSQDRIWATMAVAVNLEYVSSTTVLKGGDEVALLPPVSGGSSAAERAA